MPRTWSSARAISGFHFGDGDFWYAFSGDPASRGRRRRSAALHRHRRFGLRRRDRLARRARASPQAAALPLLPQRLGHARPDGHLPGPRTRPAAATEDWFVDDEGSAHEDDINRIAAAGITSGCTETDFCPAERSPVTRWRASSPAPWTSRRPALTTSPTTMAAPTRTTSTVSRRLASPAVAPPTRFCPNGDRQPPADGRLPLSRAGA